MIILIALSLLAGLFSLLGGLVILVRPDLTKKFITPLLSFGAGAFLGAAFLHILPEAIELSPEPRATFIATLSGFMAFFILERLLMKYVKTPHSHEHSDHTEALAFLIIVGDAFHNFLDGVVLGLAYLANPVLGFPTAIAIAAHELPQEIGDFAVLLKLGWKKTRIIAVNVLQSLLTIPGVFIGVYMGQTISDYLPLLLAAAAGIFLYIAASDLIPEIHHRAGHDQFFQVVMPAIVAMVTIFYLSGLAH